jgi:hypothetical protein
LQVIVCGLQAQEIQSPLLKHASPGPKGPGVHEGSPLEVLELELPHVQVDMVPHCAAQLASMHAAVSEPTGPRGPQFSGMAQNASVFPWY